jgi:hypothetical protein
MGQVGDHVSLAQKLAPGARKDGTMIRSVRPHMEPSAERTQSHQIRNRPAYFGIRLIISSTVSVSLTVLKCQV